MKKTLIYLSFFLASVFVILSCTKKEDKRIPVIFDTDANNELDDQHAMAYLFLNGKTFKVIAVTVNATYNGGDIEGHYDEAERVMRLCNVFDKIPLLKGANGNFEEIKNSINDSVYDGHAAVNYIIEQAMKYDKEKLVLVPVGKLTNIALALLKEPKIAKKVKIVWLGSNYPESGEYNQDNDIESMNYILSQDVEFEMVTVRYNDNTGTTAVRVGKEEIESKMKGKGPIVSEPVEGRHGGIFNNFGDYSVNLFNHCEFYGNPPSRSMFDLAAVAIIKNPGWAKNISIPAPVYIENNWVEQPNNNRKILVWEFFDRDSIMNDLYRVMDDYEITTSN